MPKLNDTNTLVFVLLSVFLMLSAAAFYFILNLLVSLIPYNPAVSELFFSKSLILAVSVYLSVCITHMTNHRLCFLHQSPDTEKIIRELNGILSEVSPGLPKKIIRKVKNKIYLNKDRIKDQLSKGKLSSKQIACLIFVDELVSSLPNGSYHIYRGILNISGSEMYRVWRYCLNYLLETGYFDEPKYNHIDNSMSVLISKAG